MSVQKKTKTKKKKKSIEGCDAPANAKAVMPPSNRMAASHRYPTRYSLRTADAAASLSPPQSQLVDLPVRGAEESTLLAACRKSSKTEAKHRINGQVKTTLRWKNREKLGVCEAEQNTIDKAVAACTKRSRTEANHIINGQAVVACGKRRKRKEQTPPSLPHDVIFKILLLLPAKLLYEVMRYVCWEWYNIVNDTAFITSHLQMMSSSSSKGILFQQFENRESAYYVERNTAGSDLEVTEFRIPIPGEIFGSCNGLVTVYAMLDHPRIFHVVNPVTGLVVSLPPVLGGREPHGQETALTCTSSGCFKVVYIAQESFEDTDAQLTIFTVGVDKSWRLINLDEMFMTRPVVVAGFVYLIDIHHRCGFALDVDSETVYRLTMPCIGEFTSIDASFVVVQERSFGVFIYVKERRRWELWDLVDVKSCKWVNIVVIDEASLLDSKLGKSFRPSTVRCFLRPFYLKNGDLWMKIQDKDGYHVVCYNLETGSFQYYQYGYAFFGHHFNSLVKI